MIALLLGGFASSTIGFCLGVKRLRRSVKKAVTAPVVTVGESAPSRG
jgi:hypothetical protein